MFPRRRYILVPSDSVTFLYSSETVGYETMKKSILENSLALTKHSFKYDWKKVLELEEFESYRDLEDFGYKPLKDEVFSTSFHRRGISFDVKIDTCHKRAKVDGSYVAKYEDKDEVIEILEVLETISGISFELVAR